MEWVEKERQMRERLKKEKEAREQREKAIVRLYLLLFLPLKTVYPLFLHSANAVVKQTRKKTRKSASSKAKMRNLKNSSSGSRKRKRKKRWRGCASS